MLTLKFFEQIPDGIIFQEGETKDSHEGINMSNSGRDLIWIAKKGIGFDWAIYTGIIDEGLNDRENILYILKYGSKVTNGANIMKCVPCEEAVFKLYRY